MFDFQSVWSVWCDRVVGELSDGDEHLAGKLADAIGYNLVDRSFTSGSLIVSGSADDSSRVMADMLDGRSAAEVNDICNRLTTGLPLVPVNNLNQILLKLKSSGLTLGVATNDSEASAREQLEQSHILEYFDFVCGYDSGFGSKPGAGMLQAFCQTTGISAAEVAMVGDSLHDINAGVAAEVGLTVGVLTGPATLEELQIHADVVMDDIAGLIELLL